jgi:creatinine amidohydrolase
MVKVKYEEMYPDEFLAAVERMPVFIVPTGLLEWHGDHLPLGQDTMKAYGICLEVAKKLGGGIVLPPNYFGRPGFSSFVGTLTYSEKLITMLFAELFGQLKKVGAKVVVMITGHYGPCQVNLVKKIAEDFMAANPDVNVIAQPEYEGVTVDGQTPADHAGKWETSMFWYFYPSLVRMEKFTMDQPRIYQYADPPENHYRENPDWKWREDLREVSSPELGKKAVDEITSHIVEMIRDALEVGL